MSHGSARQQDDIVAEISDVLQSEMEERESQLGRPLTDAEEAATGATIAALASTDRLGTSLTIVPIMWPSIFTVFGVVTVIFIIIEHVGSAGSVLVRLGVSKWDPRRLPPANVTEIPRLQILFEATVSIAFLPLQTPASRRRMI